MTWRVAFSEQLAGNPSKVLRVLDPLQHMEAAGIVQRVALEAFARRRGNEVFLDARALDSLDAVFLHVTDMNVNTRAALAPFLRSAVERGVAIVCDSDDPYFVPADGCSFQEQVAPHLDAIRELCALAHVVSVTTEPLKRELASCARDVSVVPNHLDLRPTLLRRRANQRVRIGWCGGPTHTDDLTAILPAVARLQAHAQVDFVIYGMFDRNFEGSVLAAQKLSPKQCAQDERLAAFGRMADALRRVRYQHVPSTSYAEFPARLAELDFDIGLCPLLDTRFNRCRSAVKFYQYAAAGTLTIASDADAYRGECGPLVENTTQAWVHALERFVCDSALRDAELVGQREYVDNQRNWKLGVRRYEQLFARAIESARSVRGAPLV